MSSKQIITDKDKIEQILNQGTVCTVAMSVNDKPYQVALNYGYENGYLYFHSSKKGKKIEILKKNPEVCFLIQTDVEIVRSEEACDWSMKYKSVMGFGRVVFIHEINKKISALKILMMQYSQKDFTITEPKAEQVCVFKIEIESMTLKSM